MIMRTEKYVDELASFKRGYSNTSTAIFLYGITLSILFLLVLFHSGRFEDDGDTRYDITHLHLCVYW